MLNIENSNGLKAGDYDVLTDRLIGNSCRIYGERNTVMRVSLCKNTTWKELLKALPKGSIIKSVRQMR